VGWRTPTTLRSQACGTTLPAPCNETDHFTNQNQWANPIGVPTNLTTCSSSTLEDFVLLAMTGNGVEHITINKAGDGWSTSTFTGTGTVTSYPASSLANIVTDKQGNIVSADIVGPSDGSATGKLTDGFHASINNKNLVFDGTVNFTGTDQNGNPVSLHQTQHASWTGNIDLFGPPHIAFNRVNC
jgi:hypothetical protein